jgi:hypothetical protein
VMDQEVLLAQRPVGAVDDHVLGIGLRGRSWLDFGVLCLPWYLLSPGLEQQAPSSWFGSARNAAGSLQQRKPVGAVRLAGWSRAWRIVGPARDLLGCGRRRGWLLGCGLVGLAVGAVGGVSRAGAGRRACAGRWGWVAGAAAADRRPGAAGAALVPSRGVGLVPAASGDLHADCGVKVWW